MTVAIRFARKGITGGRDYQEDYCQFAEIADADDKASGEDSEILAVLADGMGGQGAAGSGATASETACRSFIGRYAEAGGSVADRLGGALSASNESIANRKQAEPELGDMGTTLIGASFHQGNMQWVSVGDSLLYLYRTGAVQRLNEDHSLAPMLDQLAERGEMTREEALNHRSRNAVRSAVMGHEIELTDLQQEAYPLQDGDVILLASDGLDTLDSDVIAAVIQSRAAAGPEAIADALLRAVEDAGKPDQDNTMIMAITVQSDAVRATPRGIPWFGIFAGALLLAAAGVVALWFASSPDEPTAVIKPGPVKNVMPKGEPKPAKPADSNKAERPPDKPPTRVEQSQPKEPVAQPPQEAPPQTQQQSAPKPPPAAEESQPSPPLPTVPKLPEATADQPAQTPPTRPSPEGDVPAQPKPRSSLPAQQPRQRGAAPGPTATLPGSSQQSNQP